ncbi:MAG: TIR domain-containing protein [Anaerolineae bacterium]
MPRIFISYRRNDASETTLQIYERLARVYGRRSIFIDTNNIPLAKDFRAQIEAWLFHANIVLVVIGPKWENVTDDKGQRRIWLPDDAVRREIEFALVHRKRIIPLYVDGAEVPRPETLPPSIQQLVYINGLKIHPAPTPISSAISKEDKSDLSKAAKAFDRDISRLISVIGVPWMRIVFALLLIVIALSVGFLWWNSRNLPVGSPSATTAVVSVGSPTVPIESSTPTEASATPDPRVTQTPNITEVAAALYASQTAFYGTQTGVVNAEATAYQVQTLLAQTAVAQNTLAAQQTQTMVALGTQADQARATTMQERTQTASAQSTQSGASTRSVQAAQTSVARLTESARSTLFAQASQTAAPQDTLLARSTAFTIATQMAAPQDTQAARSTLYAHASQTYAVQDTRAARTATANARQTQTRIAQILADNNATRNAAATRTERAQVTPTRTPTRTPSRTPTRTPRPTTSGSTTFHITVSVASANLRSGPGTGYSLVDTVSYGDRFTVIALTWDGTWYLVDRAGGDAWISSTVVGLNEGGLIPTPATIPPLAAVQPTSGGGGSTSGTPANGAVRHPANVSCGTAGTPMRLNGVRLDLGENLTVMEQPNGGSVVAWIAQNGRVFTLAEDSASVYDAYWNNWIDWCQVRLDDGRLGWVLWWKIWACDPVLESYATSD